MIVLQLHLSRKRGASRSEMIGFFFVRHFGKGAASFDFLQVFLILMFRKIKFN
jgi:hypothetical protein